MAAVDLFTSIRVLDNQNIWVKFFSNLIASLQASICLHILGDPNLIIKHVALKNKSTLFFLVVNPKIKI